MKSGTYQSSKQKAIDMARKMDGLPSKPSLILTRKPEPTPEFINGHIKRLNPHKLA